MTYLRKLFLGSTLFLAVIAFVACNGAQTEDEVLGDSYAIIDINPSFDLILDEDQNVVAIFPGNEDAQLVLLDLDLNGENLLHVIEVIIQESIDLGFIDPESEDVIVDVATVAKNEEMANTIRAMITEKIGLEFGERGINGQARQKTYDQAFIDEAQNHGVDPDMYRLMNKAQFADPFMTSEEAKELDVEALVNQVREQSAFYGQFAQELREAFLLEKEALRDEYIPLIQDLEDQIEAAKLAEEPYEELETQLQDLKDTWKDAFADLRTNFITQSLDLVTQMRDRKENLRGPRNGNPLD